MENGYPVNQETYTKFKEKFQINNNSKEVTSKEEFSESALKLKDFVQKLDPNIRNEF
jgi:hypothetical protein